MTPPATPEPPSGTERLDAWFDGARICVIAVGAYGDPLDLSEQEVEGLIDKLQRCLHQAREG